MIAHVAPVTPVGGCDDLALHRDGDEPLLLHLARQPVPDKHPGVHRKPVLRQPDLALGVPARILYRM